MMHLPGLVLFTLFLPGAARRSARIGGVHFDAKQLTSTLAKDLEVSADAREALLPSTFMKAVHRRSDLQPHRAAPRLAARKGRKKKRAAASRPKIKQTAAPRPTSVESPGRISAALRNFAALAPHPGLATLNDDPPVYVIRDFLSPDECAAIVAEAEQGALPPIPYGRKNRIFTGSKWAATGSPSAAPFLERTAELFGASDSRFEPVTVTRYRGSPIGGEYQAQHLDARLAKYEERDAAFFASGGQRLAQVIVYLQAPLAGGETKFFNPAFRSLSVKPEVGMALVFPVATLDGTPDDRYLHSGEPVLFGTKWIIGTWLLEVERTDGEDVARAIEEMWKRAKRQ